VFYRAMDQAGKIVIATGIIMILSGCNSFGSGKQIKQLEQENNRLLSEFRAERQRKESAERAAQQLEARLAESEKMLARQLQGPPGAGRLSSLQLNSSPSIPGPSGLNPGGIGERNGPLGAAGSAAFDFPSMGAGTGGSAPGTGDLRWHRRN
jgi:hypothetical protein